MARNSKIEWCNHTVNFWWGCTKISEACRFCYAATLDLMRGPLFDNGRIHWGPKRPRWVKTDSATKELRSIAKKAALDGKRQRIFINSMADSFEDHPHLNAARAIMFAELEKHPGLDLMLLTKRPENVNSMVPVEWLNHWPSHVWVGTTVEDQAMAQKRIPQLMAVPAKVKFLSCEPLLGPLNLEQISTDGATWFPLIGEAISEGMNEPASLLFGGIDWVIVGGESGSEARPMNPDWVRMLRGQCQNSQVPFFFKQWGEWCRGDLPNGESAGIYSAYHFKGKDAVVYRDPKKPSTDYRRVYWVGKKVAGRMLDGQEWSQFPL